MWFSSVLQVYAKGHSRNFFSKACFLRKDSQKKETIMNPDECTSFSSSASQKTNEMSTKVIILDRSLFAPFTRKIIVLPGDKGWLCPPCDCKIDCIDSLNDSIGTDLSINDIREKVFPETVASGNNLNNMSGLPSDHSEDDDYTPDGDGPRVEEDGVDVEDPSSDESSDSDISSATENLGVVANKNIKNNSNSNNNNDEFLGLPSDDSEDDDFDHEKADSDSDGEIKGSESDFSFDSEDVDDVSKKEVTSAEVKEDEKDEKFLKTDVENDDYVPITARRNVKRLDYKKLHDVRASFIFILYG